MDSTQNSSSVIYCTGADGPATGTLPGNDSPCFDVGINTGGTNDDESNNGTLPGVENPENETPRQGEFDNCLSEDGCGMVLVGFDPENEPQTHIDHIQSLEDLMDEPIIKDEIDQMAIDLQTAANEAGVEFTYENDTYIPHPVQDIGFNYTKFPPITKKSKVGIHMHHNSTNGQGQKIRTVPSGEDVSGHANFL